LERKAFRVAVLIFFDDTGDMMHHIYGDIWHTIIYSSTYLKAQSRTGVGGKTSTPL
jgi:hypothetical protein